MFARLLKPLLAWCCLVAMSLFAADGGRLHVHGSGFSVGKLAEGATAFGNRNYTFRGVPEQFRGWQFTKINGGEHAFLEVTSAQWSVVHIVTGATAAQRTGMEGWETVPSEGFHYTDKNRTALGIFRKEIQPGSTVEIPQRSWTGTMVLAAALSGSEAKTNFAGVPGMVIAHQPASTGHYIGSPSIVILPDGTYVASHDFFGPKTKFNRTRVYRTADKGKNWTRIAEMDGQFWSNLFLHRGALYLMGTSREYGFVVIRRSDDGGRTWTTPKDETAGLLLGDSEYHCAPMPMLIHAGRIWRGMEERNPPKDWGVNFQAFMMSAPLDADLLNARSWKRSNRLRYDPAWGGRAWLEGNAVLTPEGKVVDILRNDHRPDERAAIVEISEDGAEAKFDPGKGFIPFPGGCKKFAIRYDAETKAYWSLSNDVPPAHQGPNPERARNTVALLRSTNLRDWEVRCVLLYHPDTVRHGFQYLDWQFEGEDLIAACRTAFDDGLGGAHNQHDANFLTFHRFEKFRHLGMKDSVPVFLERAGEK